jgi:hypothetical protein
MSLITQIRRIREPRLVLRRGDGQEYLKRWGIRTRLFSIYLHHFEAPDPGVDLHDHPWPFLAFVVKGGYEEQRCPVSIASRLARIDDGDYQNRGTFISHLASSRTEYLANRIQFFASRFNWMPERVAHRIVRVVPGTVTLVITGRTLKDRGWGFYTPYGYVPHDSYEHEDRSLVAETRDDLGAGERQELEA